MDVSTRTPQGGEPVDPGTAAALAEVVRALADIVLARRRPPADDDGPGDVAVVFARDPAALAELQSRAPLPPVYQAFLARHSSHDFVDSGLVCAGEAAWIAPVDNVAELTACCAASEPLRVVCGVSRSGHYVLELARARGDDCPVLHVDERGGAREVAGSFLGFLERVARESAPRHVVKNMSLKMVEEAEAQARRQAGAWLIGAAVVVIGLLACGVALLVR